MKRGARAIAGGEPPSLTATTPFTTTAATAAAADRCQAPPQPTPSGSWEIINAALAELLANEAG